MLAWPTRRSGVRRCDTLAGLRRRRRSSAARSQTLQRDRARLATRCALDADVLAAAQRRALGVTGATTRRHRAAGQLAGEAALRDGAPRDACSTGRDEVATNARPRMLDWLGLRGRRRAASTGTTGASEFLTATASRAARERSSTRSSPTDARPRLAIVTWPKRAHRRRRGRPPRAARRRASRCAADPRRARSPAPTRGARTRRAARLRRPDRPHADAAGRPRRRLGAVQAGRRARPPAAGRGAGHRARAMGDRRTR